MPSTPSVSAASACTCAQGPSAVPNPSRNSTLRPPQPSPRTVTVVSPPDNNRHGGEYGSPDVTIRRTNFRLLPPHLPRLALHAVRQDNRAHALLLCHTRRRCQRGSCGSDDVKLGAEQPRITGLNGFPLAALECCVRRCGQRDAVAREHGKRIGTGCRIGHGGARRDIHRNVTRHIRDGQRDEARGMTGDAEPAALDARQVPSHGIDLADGGARAQQRPRDRLLVSKRQSCRRQGQQRGTAAREQAQHEVCGTQATHLLRACAPPRAALPRLAPGAPPRSPRCARRPPRGPARSPPCRPVRRPNASRPPAPSPRQPCPRQGSTCVRPADAATQAARNVRGAQHRQRPGKPRAAVGPAMGWPWLDPTAP